MSAAGEGANLGQALAQAGSADALARAAAAESLASHAAVPEAARALGWLLVNDPDTAVSYRAARALLHAQTPAATAVFATGFTDDSRDVCDWLADALRETAALSPYSVKLLEELAARGHSGAQDAMNWLHL